MMINVTDKGVSLLAAMVDLRVETSMPSVHRRASRAVAGLKRSWWWCHPRWATTSSLVAEANSGRLTLCPLTEERPGGNSPASTASLALPSSTAHCGRPQSSSRVAWSLPSPGTRRPDRHLTNVAALSAGVTRGLDWASGPPASTAAWRRVPRWSISRMADLLAQREAALGWSANLEVTTSRSATHEC
jgi:hypothetical protein